jgi:hypothetical protein
MTMHEQQKQTMQDVQKILKSARPEQIERLLRDIMKTSDPEDEKRTGTA